MNRHTAYLGVLKYQFHNMLMMGIERRKAWKIAKRDAAEYAFTIHSDKLKLSLPVW